MTKLLGISGALRKASTNTLLVHNAAALFGADEFTLADIDLPLYNGDVEEAKGVPAKVQTLADQIAAADAVILSTTNITKQFQDHSRTRLIGSAARRAHLGAVNQWRLCQPLQGVQAVSGRSSHCALR